MMEDGWWARTQPPGHPIGESLFTLPSNQSESSHLALSQSKNFSKLTILTKHRSHASRIPSSNQSPSCHLAERKTPLLPCPSSKTCPEMGLRTVFTVQKPKKATPIQRLLFECAESFTKQELR
ncbi:uncharacterized protein TNCV_1131701 [Trichonephila clavipes]|nr:uncharacterized protein TNCV_1131701 [Trichonephila clavipes]